MGYRKDIRIRFLIILFVACFILGGASLRYAMIANNAEINVYDNGQSEKCSLESMWKKAQICIPTLQRTCPVEDAYSHSVEQLKYTQPIGRLHGTFWQALASHQTESSSENSHQILLKDIFRNLILLIFIINARKVILETIGHYASKDEAKKSITSSMKHGLIDLPSLLSSIISSSVDGLGEKVSKDEALHLKNGKKYAWMYDPVRRSIHSTEYIIFSVLDRLASFRSFSSPNESSTVYVTALAEAGFTYTGVGSIVECQGCGNLVDTSQMTSVVEAKYHREGCSYIKDALEMSSNSHTDNQGISDHHGNQEARPPTSNHHGNQEARPPTSNHLGNQEASPPNSNHHGNQEARPPTSNHHGNQEARPPTSNHHGNQEARPNSNHHGIQEGQTFKRNHHGNQEARPPNSNHHGKQNVHGSNSQDIVTDSAEPEFERITLNEQAAYIEPLPAFNNGTSSISIEAQVNKFKQLNLLPTGTATSVTLLASNSTCPPVSANTRPNDRHSHEIRVPLVQNPPQVTSLVQQQQQPQATPSIQQKTNQSAALSQQQTNATTVQGQTNATTVQGQTNATTVQGQTNEATASTKMPNSSIINPEQMGACAAPVVIDHPGLEDTSEYNALLFDTAEFAPENHICCPVKADHRTTCKKNPGHFANIPIRQLQEDHMPTRLRNSEFLEMINLVGKLTVRIVVRVTSKKRPHSENKETTNRCGTGMAITQPAENDQPANTRQSGKWNSLKKLIGKNRSYIYIQTNRHLVYDSVEAENTTVEFFYDSPNRRDVVIAKGVSIEHSQILGDFKSILKCRINDLSMVEFVMNTENKIMDLANGFPERLKKELIKRVFVISHPHGDAKMLAYGEYVMVKYALKIVNEDGKKKPQLVKINNHTQISQNPNEIRKVLLYTADTCEGSSGAVVISFKKVKINNKEEIVYDTWMHSGLCRKHGLNASVMKVLTDDDIANHGTAEIFRPSVQEVQEEEADSAANQVVSCPVYVVFGASSHPAYAVNRKRLESYPPGFTHVHTINDLADAGFFYAGYADCVRCFHCGLGLRSWMSGDGIFEEHYRNRPDCQFLQMKLKASGIDPLSLQAPDQRRIQTESQTNSANTDNGHFLHQLPNLTTEEQQPEQRCQRSLEEGSMDETQLMKQVTNLVVPNRQQEIIVAMVSGSTVQNDDLPRAPTVMSVLETEHQYLKQLLTCKVCLTKPVKDLFLPCGELIACLECSKLLSHCPSCNKKILATVTTFFS